MLEETAGYILKKNKNSSCYSLQLKGPNKEQNYVIMVQLVTTIINQIPNSFYDEITQEILFTAESVINITNMTNITIYNKTNKSNQINQNLLTEMQTIQMIKCLTTQIEYLNRNNLAFYGFDSSDIIVINENIFLFASLNYLYNLDKERNITFYTPIPKPLFSSPEFTSLKQLPAKISYKTNYYSLGAIIVYFYLGIQLSLENDTKREETLDSLCHILNPIYYTKTYWFLLRCLKNNPEKRILLFI
jgi:hypothetical protein